jgi:SNF2 family DNA or RNA helicase
VDGDGPRRKALLQQAAKQQRVIVCINHEMLQSRNMDKYPELWSIAWDAVVVDEAHKLQGRPARRREDGKVTGSQTSKGAEQLNTKRRYALTGTPVWNKPDSLYGVLHFLEPHRFTSYWRFVEEYCQVVGGEYARKIVGPNQENIERLHNLLSPMLLRRTKDQVLKDLPAKTVQEMPYDITGWLDEAYWNLKDSYIHPVTGDAEQSIPMAYADMRRLLNAPVLVGADREMSPKDEIVDDLVEQATAEGKPVVIFTWHNDYTGYLLHRLRKLYTVEAIHGPTNTTQRNRILADFQAGKIQVLVASMATMGVAIDLTVARVAVFAEGHYVNTIVDQAESRLHRNGQKFDVMIYRLYARGTIEEAIWEVADTRKEDADEMLCLDDVTRRVQAQHKEKVSV